MGCTEAPAADFGLLPRVKTREVEINAVDNVPVSTENSNPHARSNTYTPAVHNTADTAAGLLIEGVSVLATTVGRKTSDKPWKAYQKQLMDLRNVDQCFGQGQGLAIIGGEVSGGLEIIDIDDPTISNGLLSEIEKRAPGLPDKLRQVRTPSGGGHLYYRCPEVRIPSSMKLAMSSDGRDVRAETRGEGAYAVTYPTPGYLLLAGSPSTVPTITAVEREVILEVCRSFDLRSKTKIEPTPPPEQSANPAHRAAPMTPLDDFNRNGVSQFREMLEEGGWAVTGTAGSIPHQNPDGTSLTARSVHWTRPGKGTDAGGSAGLYQHPITDVWYFTNWSSSIPEIEPGTYYIGHIWAVYQQSGNYSKALADFRRMGFVGNEHAAEEDFADLYRSETDPNHSKAAKRGFRLITMAEALTRTTSVKWVLRGAYPQESTNGLVGAPGNFKSFVALDQVLCIVTGRDWHGHPVTQGPVIYIAGEGNFGLSARVRAWMLHHEIDPGAEIPLYLSSCGISVLDSKEMAVLQSEIDAVTVACGRPPVLLVIDTLARAFAGGDENSAKDMSAFIAHLDGLHPPCAKLIIHHSGHGAQGRGRGSSAWTAALDSEFSLEKRADGLIEMSCKKMKDAAPWDMPKMFRTKSVVVGVDDEGRLIDSLVLESVDTPATRPQLSGEMARALDLLIELRGDEGVGVSRDQWRTRCIVAGVYSSSKAFSNALKKMIGRKAVFCIGDQVFGGQGVISSTSPVEINPPAEQV